MRVLVLCLAGLAAAGIAALQSSCVAVVPAVTAAGAAGLYAAGQDAPDTPVIPEVQKRGMQMRSFPTTDTKRIVKGVMSALQDQDFVIDDVALDAGLVTGHKNIDVAESKDMFAKTFARVMTGVPFAGKKRSQLESSITVAEVFGEGEVRVRANFEVKIYGDNGAVLNMSPVLEPEQYQAFFSKLSKAVFLDAIMYGEDENSEGARQEERDTPREDKLSRSESALNR